MSSNIHIRITKLVSVNTKFCSFINPNVFCLESSRTTNDNKKVIEKLCTLDIFHVSSRIVRGITYYVFNNSFVSFIYYTDRIDYMCA